MVGLPISGFAELLRDEPTRKTIKWPLEFVFTEELGRNGVRTYSVGVAPYNPGGRFSWETEDGPHGRASLMSSAPSMPECGCVSTANGVVTFCCSGSCSCGGNCEASGSYYIAGSIFGVTGGVCRCGFYDPEDDEPPPPPEETPSGPSLSVEFTRPVIIFEENYNDEPGKVVQGRSTRIRLKVTANGGPNGATFFLSKSGLEKLKAVGGGQVDVPSSRTLEPNEDYSTSFVCEGVSASGSEGDVSLMGYIADQLTGQTEFASGSATVVKVTLSPIVTIDGLSNRHQWGVGEEVSCQWTPNVSGIQATPSSGMRHQTSYASNHHIYVCPFRAATDVLRIQSGDVSYTPHSKVIEPRTVVASNAERCPFSVAKNYPGGAGFTMDLHILPQTVSFIGLDVMEEVSLDSAIDGYFSDSRLAKYWYHTSDRGGGDWHHVSGGNFWFRDQASMGDTLVLPCSEGVLVWKIPIAWKEHDGEDSTSKRLGLVRQRFSMTPAGVLKVSKYQYWVERGINEQPRGSQGVR